MSKTAPAPAHGTTVRTDHQIRFMVEKWEPDHDDGESFRPGRWVLESQGTIDGTDEQPIELTDPLGPGRSIKIWVDAA